MVRKKTKRIPTERIPFVRHEEFVRAITPSFVLASTGGVLTILASIVIGAGAISPARPMADPYLGVVLTFAIAFLGVLMIISSLMLRKENYCLSGSILSLITGSMGIALGSAFYIAWLGPLLALIGGVLGVREHEELIRHTSRFLKR